jgi:hypothetical protein
VDAYLSDFSILGVGQMAQRRIGFENRHEKKAPEGASVGQSNGGSIAC